jgi:hypothetical protein
VPYIRAIDGAAFTDELAPGWYEISIIGAKPVRVEVKPGETTTVQLDSPPVRKGQ